MGVFRMGVVNGDLGLLFFLVLKGYFNFFKGDRVGGVIVVIIGESGGGRGFGGK